MGLLPEKIKYGELKLAEIVRLLAICQNKSEEQLLQSVLYNHRVMDEFHDRCKKVIGYSYRGSSDITEIAEDLFQESLILIFEKVREFECKPAWDETECEKVFLFWMSKFANYMLLNQWKKEKKERIDFDKYKQHCIDDNTPGSIGKYNHKPTYDKVKFDQLWNKFSPMAREIVLACAGKDMFEEDGPKHLKPEFRKYMSEKYKVTENAVNQAKRRALISLKLCKIE